MKRGILHNAVRSNIVKNSKDSEGKVNVNRALSVARTKGYNTFGDRVRIRRLAELEDKKNNL